MTNEVRTHEITEESNPEVWAALQPPADPPDREETNKIWDCIESLRQRVQELERKA